LHNNAADGVGFGGSPLGLVHVVVSQEGPELRNGVLATAGERRIGREAPHDAQGCRSPLAVVTRGISPGREREDKMIEGVFLRRIKHRLFERIVLLAIANRAHQQEVQPQERP